MRRFHPPWGDRWQFLSTECFTQRLRGRRPAFESVTLVAAFKVVELDEDIEVGLDFLAGFVAFLKAL